MRKAFTLVELLIVIAIIALLLSILLPALSKARGIANDSVCKFNLRSFGQAINSYINDYNCIPATTQSMINVPADEIDLAIRLRNYWDVKDPSITEKVKPWYCPNDKERVIATGGSYMYYMAPIYQIYSFAPPYPNLQKLTYGRPRLVILYDSTKYHGLYFNVLTIDGAVRSDERITQFLYSP